MQTKIRNIILIFAGAIIILFLGCLIGANLTPSVDIDAIKQNVRHETIKELNQKFNSKIEKGLIPFVAQIRIAQTQTSLNGEVVSVDSQTNTIKVNTPNLYEGNDFLKYLSQSDHYVKTVKITQETKIIRQEEKDIEQYLKEVKEYEKQGSKGSLPNPYSETQLSIDKLREGSKVLIFAESEFKLDEQEFIQATKIVVKE